MIIIMTFRTSYFVFPLHYDHSVKNYPSKVFCKKGVLKDFTKLTEKHLCLRPATLQKKRLCNRCFLVNFVKFLRTSFLQNTSGGCFCQSCCSMPLQESTTLLKLNSSQGNIHLVPTQYFPKN